MNRRGFLAALAGAAVLDPERLLWVPGKKRIFVPRPKIGRPVNIRRPPRFTVWSGAGLDLRVISTYDAEKSIFETRLDCMVHMPLVNSDLLVKVNG